jgi:hypothetical protein
MNRTTYHARLVLTARELQALERFLSRKTVAGDVALVESVLQEIVSKAKIVVAKSKSQV